MVYNKLQQETILMCTTIFLLLDGHPKNDTLGKRVRKKLLKEIKKTLAIHREQDKYKYEYLALVNLGGDVLIGTRDKLIEDGKDVQVFAITPDKLLMYLKGKRPDLYEALGISDKTLEELFEVYDSSKLGFRSLQYLNRALDIIDNMISSLDKETIDRMSKDAIEKYSKRPTR